MPDEQIADWPRQVVEPYRALLAAALQSLETKVDQARQRLDDLETAAEAELDALLAKIPESGDEPAQVEYLTVRAAQVDWDLAEARHRVTIAEAFLDLQKVHAERCELALRLGQVDHLVEDGVVASGNDDQLAILMVDAKSSSFEQVAAATSLDFARQRLTLAKRMHRDVHAALRKLERAGGPGKK
jgi:hypothetical protein